MDSQPKELASFHYAFKISAYIVFEVNYYLLGKNENKYFSTSAAEFNRTKTDYDQCGQAQKYLLVDSPKAMQFYKKWDHLQVKDLTEQQHTEILMDIEGLKANYIFTQSEWYLSFDELKELSKRRK